MQLRSFPDITVKLGSTDIARNRVGCDSQVDLKEKHSYGPKNAYRL